MQWPATPLTVFGGCFPSSKCNSANIFCIFFLPFSTANIALLCAFMDICNVCLTSVNILQLIFLLLFDAQPFSLNPRVELKAGGTVFVRSVLLFISKVVCPRLPFPFFRPLLHRLHFLNARTADCYAHLRMQASLHRPCTAGSARGTCHYGRLLRASANASLPAPPMYGWQHKRYLPAGRFGNRLETDEATAPFL